MKLFFKLIFATAGLLITGQLSAQRIKQIPISKIPVYGQSADSVRIKDSIRVSEKINQEMDVSDLIGKILKHKAQKAVDSITSKPSISVVPAVGYTLVSRLALVMAGNVAFRMSPESRISSIVLSSSISQRKQFTLPIESDIWSKNNKYNFVGDFRFYKYPQSTFGLGSNSNILQEDPMSYQYFRFYETILRHVTGNLYAGAGYIFDDHWHITDQGNFNDYGSYNGKPNHTVATGITLNALLDSRNNGINPSSGNFITVQYRDNVEFLGSTSGWRSLIVDVRKYINFPQGSDNVLALWSFDWLILSGEPGFLDLPSTQWDAYSATGRGYIQGRFRGADMVYGEAEYRYKILRNGLLGGVFFVNAESLSAAPGSKLESIQPGFGPGLRIKLNKVSKTNICIDYGFGRQGSNGLFIDVGEIF